MADDPLSRRLRARLAERAARGLARQRHAVPPPGARALVDFSGNDYLGLRGHPEIVRALQRAAERWGWGAGASPLVSGYTSEHERLEAALASLLGRDAAVVLASGFQANLAAVGALADRDTRIWVDRLAHASLIDAARASDGRWRRYPHAAVDWLAARLADDGHPKLVLTDSVFSMHGDIAPLPALAATTRRAGALLLVDEAHGFGVLGPDGRGATAAAGLDQARVPLVVVTFGKALGAAGAAVVGRRDLIDAIVALARPYVYSTALPAAAAAAVSAALEVMWREAWRRRRLERLVRHWRQRVAELGLPGAPSDTPIQPVPCADAAHATKLSQALAAMGLRVPAMRPPTVPPRQSRLRVSLSAAHSEADVDRLAAALASLWRAGAPAPPVADA